jgi:hypothetical protein
VTLEVCLLGPVEARVGGRPVALVSAKPRAVLAMLALEANTVGLVVGLRARGPGTRAASTQRTRGGSLTLRRALADRYRDGRCSR